MQPLALSPAWPEGEGILLARPLLHRSRAGLQADLEQRGLDWVEDLSNRDPAYERVRVRLLLDGQTALKARILACQGRVQLLRQLEELDGPLLLLASEAGSFMTGTIINVDGGHVNNSL